MLTNLGSIEFAQIIKERIIIDRESKWLWFQCWYNIFYFQIAQIWADLCVYMYKRNTHGCPFVEHSMGIKSDKSLRDLSPGFCCCWIWEKREKMSHRCQGCRGQRPFRSVKSWSKVCQHLYTVSSPVLSRKEEAAMGTKSIKFRVKVKWSRITGEWGFGLDLASKWQGRLWNENLGGF